MSSFRISRALSAAVSVALQGRGSHDAMDHLFYSCGAKGPPPALAHYAKWKEWIFATGADPDVDSLAFLGSLIEEFMDVSPDAFTPEYGEWSLKRATLDAALEQEGLRYYRGGQLLPIGEPPRASSAPASKPTKDDISVPSQVDDLIARLVRGLPRAMHPLQHRRKDAAALSFSREYDIQDLLHAMLRPWVRDIRPEEFTPSYAGSSTRMDFLLPQHRLVIETKLVRDGRHARKISEELIIDIEHYRSHPSCDRLLCVVYDPNHFITNQGGLDDLNGERFTASGKVTVQVMVVAP